MLFVKDDPTGNKHEQEEGPQNSRQAVIGIDQQENESDDKYGIDPTTDEDGEEFDWSMVEHAGAVGGPGQRKCSVGAQIASYTLIAWRAVGLLDAGQEKGCDKKSKSD